MIIDGKISPYKRKITALFKVAEEVLKDDFEDVSVSLNFVSEKEICELNKKFRGLEKVTDVLSFPNLNKKVGEKLKNFEKERNFDDNLLFLGDIVICKSVAERQAKEYGHSTEREVCFLALHGLLHLLGYDHIEKDDEILMQGTADEILKKCGVNR